MTLQSSDRIANVTSHRNDDQQVLGTPTICGGEQPHEAVIHTGAVRQAMHRTSPMIVGVDSAQRVPLRIAAAGGKGRGLFAARQIKPGQLVERSPVLIIPEVDRAAVDPTNVGNYIFMWEHDTTGEDLYAGNGRAALVLGYTSLVNHSDAPNCDCVRYIDALALDLVAVRTIEVGEELTIDYGMTLWFTPE